MAASVVALDRESDGRVGEVRSLEHKREPHFDGALGRLSWPGAPVCRAERE